MKTPPSIARIAVYAWLLAQLLPLTTIAAEPPVDPLTGFWNAYQVLISQRDPAQIRPFLAPDLVVVQDAFSAGKVSKETFTTPETFFEAKKAETPQAVRLDIKLTPRDTAYSAAQERGSARAAKLLSINNGRPPGDDRDQIITVNTEVRVEYYMREGKPIVFFLCESSDLQD